MPEYAIGPKLITTSDIRGFSINIIPNDDIKGLSEEVKNEPYMALAGGEDGLDFYRNIATNAGRFLTDGGLLVFEFGYNQLEQVIKILQDNNFNILDIIKDYSGNIRAVISEKGEK